MPSSAFANETILKGEYTLIDPIPGSDGRVFRVSRARDGELFSARFLTPRYAMDIARAYERLEGLAEVRHPALAALEAFGDHDGRFVIVSEFVDGRPLDRWAEAVGIPPLSRVVALVHRVCAALHVAERNQVAHAALHPGNVLVFQREEDPKPQIRVVDLGVPPFLRDWLPEHVPYMAPEQVLAALTKPGMAPEGDSRTHVYACGCFLYELCTGGAPFAEQELPALAVAHAENKVIPPSRINPTVPAALEAIIMKALARHPEARFERSADLAHALAGVRLTSSSSGVRPRVSIAPPPLPGQESQSEDKRTTARAGFEERPTVERPLPSAWPEAARLSPAPQPPPQEVPTVRPPPPTAPVPMPVAVPVTRPSQPARILPPDPFPMMVVESAPLARLEPEALATVPEPQRRFIHVPAEVRESARARKLRLVLYFAAGFAATTGLYSVVRGPSAELEPAAAVDLTTVAPSDAAAMAPAPAPASDLSRVVATQPPPERQVPVADGPVERNPAPSIALPNPSRLRRTRVEPSSNLAAQATPAVARAETAPVRATLDMAAAQAAPAPRESPRSAPAEGPHATSAQRDSDGLQPIDDESRAAHLQPAGHKLTTATAKAPAAPAPAPAPQVSLASAKLGVGSLEVRGSLATSEVRRGLDRIRSQLRACYAATPASQSAAVPRALHVEVDIDERGRARSPRVLDRAPAALSQCLAQTLQRLVSGSPPDTGTVKASFVLELSP